MSEVYKKNGNPQGPESMKVVGVEHQAYKYRTVKESFTYKCNQVCMSKTD